LEKEAEGGEYGSSRVDINPEQESKMQSETNKDDHT
jgi:hypothetical protein